MGSPVAPPRRGNPLQAVTQWVKRNKAVTALAGGGGLFLFLHSRGQGDGTDTGDTAAEDAQFGTIVPVMRALDDSNQGDYTPIPEDPPAPAEPPTPVDPPEPPEPTPAKPTPVPSKVPATPGVTLHGKAFPGANGYRFVQTKNGSHGGQYVIYAITFPGKTEYWWFYTRGKLIGRWTGPHHQPGTTPKPDAPKPTKPSKPAKPAKPSHGGPYAGHPLAYWHDPHKSRRGGKWQWPSAPGKFTHAHMFKP